jgi:hypothetical protein
MTKAGKPEVREEDVVPAWFLGGKRRRLLLEALITRPKRGWTVPELMERAACGQATAYEVVRVLSGIGLLQPPDGLHRYRFDDNHRLAEPLRSLLQALRPYASRPVQRPSRGTRRT